MRAVIEILETSGYRVLTAGDLSVDVVSSQGEEKTKVILRDAYFVAQGPLASELLEILESEIDFVELDEEESGQDPDSYYDMIRDQRLGV